MAIKNTRMAKTIIVPCICFVTLFFGCKKKGDTVPDDNGKDLIEIKNPVSKGSRAFGIHITQAENNNYEEEFQRSKALGMDAVTLTFLWNTIETDSGFNFDFIDIVNSFYPSHNVKVSICISPIGAISRAVPTKYKDLKFSDPQLINGFQKLLKAVNARTKAVDFTAIILGNEVDLYLNKHSEEWTDYQVFVSENRTFIKTIWGNNMRVGVETTFNSMVNTSVGEVGSLNQEADVIVLSYYPINEKFIAKPISSIANDLNAVFNLFPNKKIYIGIICIYGCHRLGFWGLVVLDRAG